MDPRDAERIDELRAKAARIKSERQYALNNRDLVTAGRLMREDNEITEELKRLAAKYGL